MWPEVIKRDLYPLIRLAFPLVLTGMVGASIGFFQTVFLAHLSHEAMAAGALVSWLFGVFVVIIFGTLSSINISGVRPEWHLLKPVGWAKKPTATCPPFQGHHFEPGGHVALAPLLTLRFYIKFLK
ncbi:MAG: hypothetical protein Q8R83_08870 [Legionellaceae bacterium]|nr:hypothetical protein [Legionellaceae bacterium]